MSAREFVPAPRAEANAAARPLAEVEAPTVARGLPGVIAGAEERGRRGARGPARWWARTLCFALLLLAVAGLAWWSGVWRFPSWATAPPWGSVASENVRADGLATHAALPEAASSGPADRDGSAEAARWRRARQALARLEGRSAGGERSLGAGFLIDARGLVATSYHVVSSSTRLRAIFPDGSAHEVRGYAALDPAHDLAILRLVNAPENVEPMPLAGAFTAEPFTPVLALGHPLGLDFSLAEGKISRRVLTTDLPAGARRFVAQQTGSSVNHVWLQHTAPLAPGNSGGPLLSAAGEVVGVNTWVDDETRLGYALGVDRLARLREELFAEPQPLWRHALPDARAAALRARFSAASLDDLARRLDAIDWFPQTDGHFDLLDELAFALTCAQLPAGLGAAELRDAPAWGEFQESARRVLGRLRQRGWRSPEAITLINDFAATQVTRPRAGVFCFATVVRVVEGERGARGAIMQLAGDDRQLFLTLDGQVFAEPPGANCLVIGVNLEGRVVRYGDNPLRLTTAPVIASADALLMPWTAP